MPLTAAQRTNLVHLCESYERHAPHPYTHGAEQALPEATRAAVVEAQAELLRFLAGECITQADLGAGDLPRVTRHATVPLLMIASPARFMGEPCVAADALRAAGLAPVSLELNGRQRLDLALLCDAHDAARAGDYLAYVTATAALVGYVAAERLTPAFFAGGAEMLGLVPAHAAAQMVECAKQAKFAAAFAPGRFGYDVLTAAGIRLTA